MNSTMFGGRRSGQSSPPKEKKPTNDKRRGGGRHGSLGRIGDEKLGRRLGSSEQRLFLSKKRGKVDRRRRECGAQGKDQGGGAKGRRRIGIDDAMGEESRPEVEEPQEL